MSRDPRLKHCDCAICRALLDGADALLKALPAAAQVHSIDGAGVRLEIVVRALAAVLATHPVDHIDASLQSARLMAELWRADEDAIEACRAPLARGEQIYAAASLGMPFPEPGGSEGSN